jgi:hypothetical protein
MVHNTFPERRFIKKLTRTFADYNEPNYSYGHGDFITSPNRLYKLPGTEQAEQRIEKY